MSKENRSESAREHRDIGVDPTPPVGQRIAAGAIGEYLLRAASREYVDSRE